jgi:hypothetical protein
MHERSPEEEEEDRKEFDVDPQAVPGRGYEFSQGENALLGDLARQMRGVALALLLLSLAALVFGAASWHRGGPAAALPLLAAALLNLPICRYSFRAAAEFRLIVTTAGKDIRHLMEALDSLRKMYAFVNYLLLAGGLLLFGAGIYNYVVTINAGPG